MIDVHCHILPGLDDGAQTIEDALAMAAKLEEAGFDTVIATPHVLEGRKTITPAQIREKVHELNAALAKNGRKLKILPGAEIFIFPALAEWYKQGKILSLADTGKYILVELPMQHIPPYTEQVFFELQLAGVTPLLAHPERNSKLVKNPQKLVEWIGKGVQLQVNFRSFQGLYGSGPKQLAEALLSNGMVHYLGSDLHSARGWGMDLKEIAAGIRELAAFDLVAATADNPAHILQGEPWSPQSPPAFRTSPKPRKKGLLNCLQVIAGKI